MKILSFYIETDFKPYTRMTQRGKYVKPDALAYLASQRTLALRFSEAMKLNGWEQFERVPLAINVLITMKRGLHEQDYSNQVKAIEDSMQKIVFPNDCWIDMAFIRRRLGDKDSILFTVWEHNELDNTAPLNIFPISVSATYPGEGDFLEEVDEMDDATWRKFVACLLKEGKGK